MSKGSTGNRPDLAGPSQNAWTGKEIEADLGPGERGLYRPEARNQAVPRGVL